MKWALLLLVVVLPVQADWFRFIPCGFGHDVETVPLAHEMQPEFIKAPGLSVVLWWIPQTVPIRIVQLSAKSNEMTCSWLSVGTDEWLVQGSAKEIYQYLVDKRTRRLIEK